MSINAILYLLQIYWPFLLIAMVIGIATGWYSQPHADTTGDKH